MPDAPRPNPPGRTRAESAIEAAKAALRDQVRAGRQVPEPAAAGRSRTAAALAISRDHETLALYCSVGTEPDTWPLIDALYGQGCTVLLPVLGRWPDGAVRRTPDWAVYAGPVDLRAGYAGIPEPTSPALGADALRTASLIWCAALAATPSGRRLGTGGGWYDRALAHAAPDAVVGVLLRDREVVADVPVEWFDRPVDVIVTESRTIRVTRPDPGGEYPVDAGR